MIEMHNSYQATKKETELKVQSNTSPNISLSAEPLRCYRMLRSC